MFGYIRPYVPLLRVKDNELYNAIYCGVCNSLDNCYGKISSASLSYDITFLAVVRLALSGEPFTVSKERCRYNPFKHCRIAVSSAELDFCAAVGVLLTYYKLLDNVHDERGIKAFAARLACLVAAPKRKKVIKKHGEVIDSIIADGLSRISALEHANTRSVDAPSDAFGEMLGKIAAEGYDGKKAVIANAVGMAVGKWIYIIDAIDDCEKDQRLGAYNPILSLYGRAPTDEEYDSIAVTLNAILERLFCATDLIDYRIEEGFEQSESSVTSTFSDELKEIIDNTVKFGMPKACDKVIKAKKS